MESEPLPDLEIVSNVLQSAGLSQLMVCLSHSWGGLEQVAANDTLELANLGLKVSALCLQGSPIHEFLSKHSSVRLIPLDYKPRNFMDFGMKRDLLRLVDEDGISLIHTHQPSLLGTISPWLWNRRRVSLFASRHILSDHDKRDFLHRAIYSRVDFLIVMSETLRQNVLATHPLHERRVRVVKLGLDFDRFDPEKVDAKKERASWGADSDTIVIGLVGRIDPAKGQATFIKAAAGLLKTRKSGDKLKFVMVGEETLGSSAKHLEELRAMVRQFHLEDFVVFAGYQENIPEVMSAFDIFVMPSRQEAFGLVAIEAMAMECPIVISSGGSAKEIVGQEDYGLMIRPGDAFDLQQKLRQLLDSPDLRIKMGKRARGHVRKNYDRKARLAQTLGLYERALRRRSAL